MSWEQGLRDTVQWYATEDLSSYWSDFVTALKPHPCSYISDPFTCRNSPITVRGSVDWDASEQESTRADIFLIYGRTGWIEACWVDYWQEATSHTSTVLHVSNDRKAIEADIDHCRPTHILNAAGITGRPNVDWCESHKREVVQTNVLGTLNIIDCASEASMSPILRPDVYIPMIRTSYWRPRFYRE